MLLVIWVTDVAKFNKYTSKRRRNRSPILKSSNQARVKIPVRPIKTKGSSKIPEPGIRARVMQIKANRWMDQYLDMEISARLHNDWTSPDCLYRNEPGSTSTRSMFGIYLYNRIYRKMQIWKEQVKFFQLNLAPRGQDFKNTLCNKVTHTWPGDPVWKYKSLLHS